MMLQEMGKEKRKEEAAEGAWESFRVSVLCCDLESTAAITGWKKKRQKKQMSGETRKRR